MKVKVAQRLRKQTECACVLERRGGRKKMVERRGGGVLALSHLFLDVIKTTQ